MSDIAPLPPSKEIQDHLQHWAKSLEEVVGQISGAPCAVSAIFEPPAEISPPAPNDSHLLITVAGSLRGEISVRLPASGTLALGQLMLGETQNPSVEFAPEHRDAAVELFRQVAGRVATAIDSSMGEIQLRVESGAPPSWAVAATTWMSSAPQTTITFQTEWQISAALAAELAAAAARSSAALLASTNTANIPSASPSPEFIPADKLGLFKDVELDVTLCFGGRRMLLREILELGPGAVIELDRQVHEPVDLLLDGRAIAHGEVVVVEGNYGLRVLEVVVSHR